MTFFRPSLNQQRLALALCAAAGSLLALAPQGASAQATSQAPVTTAGGRGGATDVSGVVVNGVPYRETVLPTRLKTTSALGLDLNVMDTPRNATLLSTTQLETLNIEDPRAFSYLTSSSYTDSAFGTPNIPRIRGQFADVFYNGMRDSFTQNGYGAPINFDSFDNIAITKGPAAAVDGPGPGVGGEVDLLTKRPSLTTFAASAQVTLDTVENHRWTVDVGGPIIPDQLGARISYSGEDSGSYFYGHFMRKNAVYAAVRWQPNSNYRLDFNTEINVEQYVENIGVNRVNQQLIDNNQYLTGAPDGNECFSTFSENPPGSPTPCNYNGLPIGSPGNPYSPVVPILTEVALGAAVPLNPRVTIDETPGTTARALMYNAQLIQTLGIGRGLTLESNTFFNYLNSDNQDNYYFADESNGSWSIEEKLDLNGNFDFNLGGLNVANQFVSGFDFRFAHVNYITNFSNETLSVYDLTSNPALWVFSPSYQILGDALPYTSVFGRLQYGVSGRDPTNAGNSGISDVWDNAFFFQDRLEFTPQWSFLLGARIDAVQDRTRDVIPCYDENFCDSSLPEQHSTGVYGLGDLNTSLVWRPIRPVTAYVTFDWTQSLNPNGGDGGINAFTNVPDRELMRSTSFLYEAGLKLNLFHDRLFIGSAVFDQKHGIPTGPGGTQTDQANIRGVEVETNYQPMRSLYVTASYSYIDTTLNKAAGFYNYPAEPGFNIDGAGLFAVFEPGKFRDPGVPQHVFNFLANYKFPIGIGLRFGVQVTGPIPVTTSGQLDPNASEFVPAAVVANNYYYQSPVIPWQYTMNAAVFYEFKNYTVTVSCYNFTNQRNWQSSDPFYGNDMLVRNDPRTWEVRLQAKF